MRGGYVALMRPCASTARSGALIAGPRPVHADAGWSSPSPRPCSRRPGPSDGGAHVPRTDPSRLARRRAVQATRAAAACGSGEKHSTHSPATGVDLKQVGTASPGTAGRLSRVRLQRREVVREDEGPRVVEDCADRWPGCCRGTGSRSGRGSAGRVVDRLLCAPLLDATCGVARPARDGRSADCADGGRGQAGRPATQRPRGSSGGGDVGDSPVAYRVRAGDYHDFICY